MHSLKLVDISKQLHNDTDYARLHSNTRVILEVPVRLPMIVRVAVPLVPVLADPLRLGHLFLRHHLLEVFLPFEDLQGQPTGCMPRNMTVQQPRPWVVRLERDDEKSTRGKQSDIAAWRVVPLDGGAVDQRRVIALGKKGKVVAVEVDLVRVSALPATTIERNQQELTGCATETKDRWAYWVWFVVGAVMTRYTHSSLWSSSITT